MLNGVGATGTDAEKKMELRVGGEGWRGGGGGASRGHKVRQTHTTPTKNSDQSSLQRV